MAVDLDQEGSRMKELGSEHDLDRSKVLRNKGLPEGAV